MKDIKAPFTEHDTPNLARRLLSFVVAFCVAIASSLSGPVALSSAESAYDTVYLSGDFYYSLDESAQTACIRSYECYDSAELDIPETIDGYTVTGIGNRALFDHTELTSVTFPDSITYITIRAFVNCSNITSIALPEGTEWTGSLAFAGCSSLEWAYVPAGMSSIGSNAFPSDTTIYGYEGSKAEEYCEKHGNTFVSLGCVQDDDGSSSSGSSGSDSGNGDSGGSSDSSSGSGGSGSSSTGSTKSVKVTKASVKLAKTTCLYNGTARKPKVKSVKVGGKKIGKSHYSTSYSNNVEPGTAKVKVTFKNGYSGSVTKKFKIRFARAKINSLISEGYGAVAISCCLPNIASRERLGQDYDTVFQVRYRVKGARKWKVWKACYIGELADIDNLSIGKTYQIQVRATKKANGKRRYGKWSKAKSVKVTRYYAG